MCVLNVGINNKVEDEIITDLLGFTKKKKEKENLSES